MRAAVSERNQSWMFSIFLCTGDIVMFLAGNSNTGTTRGSPREPDSSTQYQLVTVDPSGQFLPELSDTEADLFDYPDQDNSDFDTQLLVLDSSEGETNPQPQREDSANKAGCNFVGLIQLGLYKFIAVPIQKFWYIVVFLYIVLLCTTVGIDTMIKVSSQPPAFFRKDTNLQQLLELRSNMSDGNYDISNCEVCAAIIDNVIHTNSLGNPTSLPPRKPTVSTTVATTITTPTPPKDGGQGGKPNRPHIEQPKTQSTTVSHPTKGTEAPHRGTGKPTQTPARWAEKWWSLPELSFPWGGEYSTGIWVEEPWNPDPVSRESAVIILAYSRLDQALPYSRW